MYEPTAHTYPPKPLWPAAPPAVPYSVQQGDAKALPAIAQSTPSQPKFFPVQVTDSSVMHGTFSPVKEATAASTVKMATDSSVKEKQGSPVKDATTEISVEKDTNSPVMEAVDSSV